MNEHEQSQQPHENLPGPEAMPAEEAAAEEKKPKRTRARKKAEPEAEAPAQDGSNGHARTEKRDRSIQTVRAGDAVARLIEKGNYGGMAVKFDFANEEERPSEEVRRILKEEGGMRWNGKADGWKAKVDRDNPIGSRMQIEQTFADAVDQMRAEKEGQAR